MGKIFRVNLNIYNIERRDFKMSIALFGAGKDGIRAMQELGKEKVSCFIDNNRTGTIEEIPIKRLAEIDSDVVIFITSKKYSSEIAQQLTKNGFANFFIYTGGKAVLYRDNRYDERLTSTEWAKIYNDELLDRTVDNVLNDRMSIQSLELLKLSQKDEKILEIGCGSGETSLFLAKYGRIASAMDFSQNVIRIVNRASEFTGYRCETYCMDATKPFPFEEKEFDVIFQAGLLEHFTKKEQVFLLKNWKKHCKKMISLVPNAHSIAYRYGKYLMEKRGEWQYGMEIPQESLREQFEEVGLINIMEYTIGDEHALNFLPQDHYLRLALSQWISDMSEDRGTCGQGYLLVTIGENP